MKPKTALATTDNTLSDDAAALAQIEGLDDMPDGLGKLRPEDVKIRSYVLNMKGLRPDGRKIAEDEFYDTLDEVSKPTVDAVLLLRRMTRAFTFFDEATQRTQRVCSSPDEVTGRMADGTTRPCKGCPDWTWTQKDGKPHRNCGPVLNMFMLDRETQQPFVFRARRTSLAPAQTHLQRHHINQRYAGGKYSNQPLFVYQLQLTCKMAPKGTHALPVFNRGPVLSSAEVHRHKASSQALEALLDSMLEHLDSGEPSGGGDEPAPDTSFDPSRFTAPAGGAASANGFDE